MKVMNVSPLSFFLIVTFTTPHTLWSAEAPGGQSPLDAMHSAYRSTGPIPVPHQLHQHPSASPGSYPPSYTSDDRCLSSSDQRTPPSAYFSDGGYPPHSSQFPPYAYPYGQLYPPMPGYLPPAGPLSGAVAAEPLEASRRGHTRQRSASLNLGDLTLGTDTDTKELPVPRQLQDSFGAFTESRARLVAAVQLFLKTATEEGKAIIQEFDTLNSGATGESSPAARRRDSVLEKGVKLLQSKDKKAEDALAQQRKDLLARAEPFNARVDVLAAQFIRMRNDLETATTKLSERQSK